MLEDKFKETLKFLYSELKDKCLTWVVIGSTNLALQGIEVNPHDIDIITNPENLKTMEKIFRDYVTKPIYKKPPLTKNSPESYELKLSINNIEVQIIGEHESDIYYSQIRKGNLVQVELDNIKVPCFALKSEAETYAKIGREYKAKLIRDFFRQEKI